MELIKAPLDPTTMRLTARAVQPLLTRRTVAIYASAPCFSFGAVDEIESLGRLAQRRGIGLHVDCCLGGVLLSFMQREGLFTRPWDFHVAGVTTISVDLHKYGYASKGASVTAFRDPALRRALSDLDPTQPRPTHPHCLQPMNPNICLQSTNPAVRELHPTPSPSPYA